MRLWSLHPRYLDSKGLVALWREALLAQAVLAGRTSAYQHHPQLRRFRDSGEPRKQIAEYLKAVHAEAIRRGYRFDARRIGRGGQVPSIAVTKGQLAYEWSHLRKKLKSRAPGWLKTLRSVKSPEPNPLFNVVPGAIAEWEVGARP